MKHSHVAGLLLSFLVVSCSTLPLSNKQQLPDVDKLIATFKPLIGKHFNFNSDIFSIKDPSQVASLPNYELETITGVASEDGRGAAVVELTYHLRSQDAQRKDFVESYRVARKVGSVFDQGFEEPRYSGPSTPFKYACKEAGTFKVSFVPSTRYLFSGKSLGYYSELDLETVMSLSNPTFGAEVQFTITLSTNAELPTDDPMMPLDIEKAVIGFFQFPNVRPLYFGAVNPLGLGRASPDFKTTFIVSGVLYGSEATTFLAQWQDFKTRANFGKDKDPKSELLGTVSLNLRVTGEGVVLHPEVRKDSVIRLDDL